jgi:hypothetical protein
MLYIEKQKFRLKNNGNLEKLYNVRMKRTNKGYNIVGYNNGKIINKHVRYLTNSSKMNSIKMNNSKLNNKPNKRKTTKKTTNKKKTIKKKN